MSRRPRRNHTPAFKARRWRLPPSRAIERWLSLRSSSTSTPIRSHRGKRSLRAGHFFETDGDAYLHKYAGLLDTSAILWIVPRSMRWRPSTFVRKPARKCGPIFSEARGRAHLDRRRSTVVRLRILDGCSDFFAFSKIWHYFLVLQVATALGVTEIAGALNLNKGAT
jgi:hypothetical protein